MRDGAVNAIAAIRQCQTDELFETAWCAPVVVGELIVSVYKSCDMGTLQDTRSQRPMWFGVQCCNVVKAPMHRTIIDMVAEELRFVSAGIGSRIF
jgi:hypothetical protein